MPYPNAHLINCVLQHILEVKRAIYGKLTLKISVLCSYIRPTISKKR